MVWIPVGRFSQREAACNPKNAGMSYNRKSTYLPAGGHPPGRGYPGLSGFSSASGASADHFTDKPLPRFLRDMIASPPKHGDGVHLWLFKLARQLHAHRDEESIFQLLAAQVDGCGRHVPEREIRDAIASSKSCAWKPSVPGNATISKPAPKWPPVDEKRRADVIVETKISRADLFDMSPTRLEGDNPDSEWFVDMLFPGNPLLCCGYSNQVFDTREREFFRGKLHEQSLIVPSPMSAPVGIRKSDGKLSAHTLDNTGSRKYLVTEFDHGTADEQAAIIHHLSGFVPLVMIVSSGGKSLHAWWWCSGETEDTQLRFFRYAVSLGADSKIWTRCQFVRLPMGWRTDKARRQQVFYFDHAALEDGGAA